MCQYQVPENNAVRHVRECVLHCNHHVIIIIDEMIKGIIWSEILLPFPLYLFLSLLFLKRSFLLLIYSSQYYYGVHIIITSVLFRRTTDLRKASKIYLQHATCSSSARIKEQIKFRICVFNHYDML